PRAVHPVEHQQVAAGLDVGEPGREAVRDLDRAHRVGLARVLWALVARRPGRADAADEVDSCVETFRQLGRNFARADADTVLVNGVPAGDYGRRSGGGRGRAHRKTPGRRLPTD